MLLRPKKQLGKMAAKITFFSLRIGTIRVSFRSSDFSLKDSAVKLVLRSLPLIRRVW